MTRVSYWFNRTLIFLLFLTPYIGLAQDATPTASDWDSFLVVLKTSPGTPLAIAFILTQGCFLLFRTALGRVLGLHKLLILAILSSASIVLGRYMTGHSLLDSLFGDASALISYQVLLNQVFKQWSKLEQPFDNCDPSAGVRAQLAPPRLPKSSDRFKLPRGRN